MAETTLIKPAFDQHLVISIDLEPFQYGGELADDLFKNEILR